MSADPTVSTLQLTANRGDQGRHGGDQPCDWWQDNQPQLAPRWRAVVTLLGGRALRLHLPCPPNSASLLGNRHEARSGEAPLQSMSRAGLCCPTGMPVRLRDRDLGGHFRQHPDSVGPVGIGSSSQRRTPPDRPGRPRTSSERSHGWTWLLSSAHCELVPATPRTGPWND